VSPRPRLDPERKRIARAQVRLEKWMWKELDAITAESDGAFSLNDVINDLLGWAIESYRKPGGPPEPK
jgi:hypothetical protein